MPETDARSPDLETATLRGPPLRISYADRVRAELRARAFVDEKVIESAEALSARSGRGLCATLVDMGAISDEQQCQITASVLEVPVWNGRGDIPEELPFAADFHAYNRILPVVSGNVRYLVIAESEDPGLVEMLQTLRAEWVVAVGPESEVGFRLDKAFGGAQDQEQRDADEGSVEHLKDLALEAPTIRYVNDLILTGIKLGASDIHLEPLRSRVELRYRVDGVLHSRSGPQIQEYPAVVSRLKILSNLDIAERRLPQDGRFSIKSGGKDVDIRISTVPTIGGEDVAMRLLDQKKQLLELGSLGLANDFIQAFSNALSKSYGLILVTGPTGSGKTTTLYSGLKSIIDGEKKIITVEDPVEYDIHGVAQIPVNAEIGLTFAGALRSILRHDPDVILVGEIRDRETAEIAIQAALTGHLVLSTIHTNSGLGAIGRLLNMGLPDYLVANSLHAVSGQRLVRRLCESCKKPKKIGAQHAQLLSVPPDTKVYQAVGCETCNRIGYRGRLPIGEFCELNAPVRSLILDNPTEEVLVAAARDAGFRSMLDDGARRVVLGETTAEEVLRVAG